MTGITLRSDLKVSFIQQVGSDDMIAAAARVSTTGLTGMNQQGVDGLINYLLKHRHGGPFECGSMTVAVEAPIFVAREFMRHRIGWSYSETSARYMDLQPQFYIPVQDRPLAPAGPSARPTFTRIGNEAYAEGVRALTKAYQQSYDDYEYLTSIGWAREMARSVLGTGIYTTWYATANPRSLMHFLGLRTSSAKATFPSYPQYEIEQVAARIEALFAQHWPISHNKWDLNGRVAP